MDHLLTLEDIRDLDQWISTARKMKVSEYSMKPVGQSKVLGLLFFNSSLRTRMSMQRAAYHLGMDVISLNVNADGWALETADGTIMDQGKAEHIKEAAMVISQYCDIIGIRAFSGLRSRVEDEQELMMRKFVEYGSVPVINMESATAHPLQALADIITLEEHGLRADSKVVLSWAPHPRALPHAVPCSFARMMRLRSIACTITHPVGYDLPSHVVGDIPVVYDQDEALKDADYVYVKNWSSYEEYGQVLNTDRSWMMTYDKLNRAKVMHCLPVRRNVVISDDALDSDRSMVIDQSQNRIWSAQCALYHLLDRNQ